MAGATRYEDLQALLKAIKEYKGILEENFVILKNAANVCDATMGSDDLSRRHIGNLEEALKELTKATQIAEEATQAVAEAIRDYDDI